MGEQQENMDEALLVKYALGEADADEIQAVELWILASDENKKFFESVKKLLGQPSHITEAFEKGKAKAWENLNSRIEAHETSSLDTRKSKKWIWMAAASVLLLAGAFSIFHWLKPSQQMILESRNHTEVKVLSDKSVVTLNANSSIQYPHKFKGKIRELTLEGEAFFEVEPNPKKPFVIEAGIGVIKVLGTSFNVEAYQGEDLRVSVATGKVQLLLANTGSDTSTLVLEAGSVGVIEYDTYKLYKLNDASYNDALFWYSQKLSFVNTPLLEVFKVLEKNYNVHFQEIDNFKSDCVLTASFEKESISSILEVIAATFNIEFKEEGNVISLINKQNDCFEIQ